GEQAGPVTLAGDDQCVVASGGVCFHAAILARFASMLPGWTLTAAERVHDLDTVAFGQFMGGVHAARNDLSVDLDRDPALAEPGLGEQGGDGAWTGQGVAGAVQLDFHAAIVAG